MCFSGLLLLISFREPALFSLMSSLEPVRHLVNFVFVVLVKFLRGGGGGGGGGGLQNYPVYQLLYSPF